MIFFCRFVQENIAAFGGNPSTVTIFGMSAGGASVHYHMLSPMSQGLFSQAISLSGSALNWWANVPGQGKYGAKVAELNRCKRDTPRKTLECLRKVPFQEIANSHKVGGYLCKAYTCLLYTSPSPRDRQKSRMPSSA